MKAAVYDVEGAPDVLQYSDVPDPVSGFGQAWTTSCRLWQKGASGLSLTASSPRLTPPRSMNSLRQRNRLAASL